MKKKEKNITPNTYNGNVVGTPAESFVTPGGTNGIAVGTYAHGFYGTLNYNCNGTSNYNLWSNPEFIDVVEKGDCIEMIYKETSMICYTSFPAPPPEVRVFKFVFSCIDGKWNKSERIYGKIVPASGESYKF